MTTVRLKSPDSHFVQVDIEFAKEYGLNEAVMAGKMLRLQEKLTGAIDGNGKKWIRLTLEEWRKELPFMTGITLRRTIENLEKEKIILSTTFTGRSKWYRLNPEFMETNEQDTTAQKEQIDYDNCSKRADTTAQIEQLPRVPSYDPIKERKQQRPPVIPAVQVFVEVTGKYCLSRPQMVEVARVVGRDEAALKKWGDVVRAWVLRGHKPTNAAGMLDWFANGIPQYTNGQQAPPDSPKQKLVYVPFARNQDDNL